MRLARQNCHATQANKNWNPVPGIRNPQDAIHNSGLSWITLHGTNSDAGFSRFEVRGRQRERVKNKSQNVNFIKAEKKFTKYEFCGGVTTIEKSSECVEVLH